MSGLEGVAGRDWRVRARVVVEGLRRAVSFAPGLREPEKAPVERLGLALGWRIRGR